MSKTLKKICDAALIRSALDEQSSYFGDEDKTAAYLANESLESLLRAYPWPELRRTGTITMTTATLYDLPVDIKYYIYDTMNASNKESAVKYPCPTNQFWYYKTHSPSGINFKIRQVGNQLEILNPDSGTELKFEYVSSYAVNSNAGAEKSEFTADSDTWQLDDELIILDLKWRFMKIQGIEGWETEKMIFNDHSKLLRTQTDGASTLNFCGSQSGDLSIPYTDLYV